MIVSVQGSERGAAPVKGVTLDCVLRPQGPSLKVRAQAPDGHNKGGSQPTDISMINRRKYRPRLSLVPGDARRR